MYNDTPDLVFGQTNPTKNQTEGNILTEGMLSYYSTSLDQNIRC
jgi:hypothetical protein